MLHFPSVAADALHRTFLLQDPECHTGKTGAVVFGTAAPNLDHLYNILYRSGVRHHLQIGIPK